MTKIKDLAGQVFSRVTVLEFDRLENHKSFWKCRCSCGKEFIAKGISLTQMWTQSCGCLLKEKEHQNGDSVGRNNLAKYIESKRKPAGESSRNHLFYLYKYKAEKRGLSFELSLEEFSKITKENCFYCGAEPNQIKLQKGKNPYIYNGIDRYDNDLGYTFQNSIPCCKHCNTAKLSMSGKEFFEWVSRIYNNWVVNSNTPNPYRFLPTDLQKELDEQGISK